MDWWLIQGPKLLNTDVCVWMCVYLDKAVCCTVLPQCAGLGRCPLRELVGGCCRFVSSCSVPLHMSQSTWTMKTNMTSCRPLNPGDWCEIIYVNAKNGMIMLV